MKKGKFIVIDGIDGSGKATQVALLEKALRKKKIKVKKIDFPRYYDNFFGAFIAEVLHGAHGDFASVNPYIASVLYAADRFESSGHITTWLKKGYTVIADRYVSSNQIHQGGKITDPKKRKNFLEWLDVMEHEVFKIPRPDIIIYLDLPLSASLDLIKKRKENDSIKRSYLKGKEDIVEKNIKYLDDSRRSAMKIVKKNNNWIKINCFKTKSLRAKEDIHTEIVSILARHKMI